MLDHTLPAEIESTSARKLVLNLTVDGQRRVTVRSCEIVAKGFRNRTSFGECPEPSKVLAVPIVRAVERCLEAIKHEDCVVALPEFIVELPGLLLRGAHVLVSKENSRCLHVILRFQQFLGDLGALFCQSIGFDEGLSDQADQLAALTFSDIVLPILNVVESIRLGHVPRDALGQLNIDDLSGEVGFHAELLKRFVQQRQGRRSPSMNASLQVAHEAEILAAS